MPKIFKNAAGSIVADGRHVPIAICGWTGRINEDLLRQYFLWKVEFTDRLKPDKQVVLIHDFARLARPTPAVRHLAHKLDAETKARTECAILHTYVVVTNPIIRGALLAVGWMSSSGGLNADLVKTRLEAFQAAIACLDRHGLVAPAGLDTERYSLPPTDGKQTHRIA